MPVFQLARRPTHALRIVLAAMLLAFALNSIAHVSHRHDATPTSTVHSLSCGYCASFGSLADAPKHTHSSPARELVSVVAAAAFEPSIPVLAQTSAQPRAPPLS
jgi:hypothetical protein